MTNGKFEIVSKYAPSGDQPRAIEASSSRANINQGVKEQVLLGAIRYRKDIYNCKCRTGC